MKTAGRYTSTPSFRASVIELLHQHPPSDQVIDEMEIAFSWQNLVLLEARKEENHFMEWMMEVEFTSWGNVLTFDRPLLKLPAQEVSLVLGVDYFIRSRNHANRNRRRDTSKVIFLKDFP